MDGENHGKPYFLMDDLGGFHPLFLETPIWKPMKYRATWRIIPGIHGDPCSPLRIGLLNTPSEYMAV